MNNCAYLHGDFNEKIIMNYLQLMITRGHLTKIVWMAQVQQEHPLSNVLFESSLGFHVCFINHMETHAPNHQFRPIFPWQNPWRKIPHLWLLRFAADPPSFLLPHLLWLLRQGLRLDLFRLRDIDVDRWSLKTARFNDHHKVIKGWLGGYTMI